MPQTSTDIALVAIAAALWLQTIVIVGFGVGAWRMSRRAHELLGREAEALRTKVDEAIVEVRAAAKAMARLGTEAEQVAVGAQHAVDDIRGVIRVATTAVSAPRTLLMAGLSAGARTLLGRWRSSRARRFAPTDRERLQKG